MNAPPPVTNRPTRLYPQLVALGDAPLDALRAVYGPNPLPAVHPIIRAANRGDEAANAWIFNVVRRTGEL